MEGREGERNELRGGKKEGRGQCTLSLCMTNDHLTLASWAFGQPQRLVFR